MKLNELRLMLLFEQEPLLRASIRELSRRAGLNYRAAYEAIQHFFEEDVLDFERFGNVKVCRAKLGSEQCIAALAEASLARWLLALGSGPLNGRGSEPDPHIEELSDAARELSAGSGALALLAAWPRQDSPVRWALPKRFSLVAVAPKEGMRDAEITLKKSAAGFDRERDIEVHTPESIIQRLFPGEDGRCCSWLVLMGHERFWRILGGALR